MSLLPGGEPGGLDADSRLRLTYLEARVAEALYGPARWHRAIDARVAGAHAYAIEIVRLPFAAPDAAIAVVHLQLPDDPLDALAELTRVAQGDELSPLLPPGARVPVKRARLISHLTFAAGPIPVLPPPYASWPPDRQWLWTAASATPVSRYPPDVDDPALFEGLVRLSADWRALVLRDGTAFVGLTADPGGPDTFHDLAAAYVHTIYLDILLLGHMQVAALTEMSNALARVRVTEIEPRLVARLEARFMDIRRVLWLGHVTLHGHGNEILGRYQQQHRLPAVQQGVQADLTDAARLIEADAARRVSAALGILTVLGLPFGVVYAAGAVLADPSPGMFGLCTAVAAALTVLLVTLVPPVRRMTDALRPGRGATPGGG